MSKSWKIEGTYSVKAIAKDNKGAISDWSKGKRLLFLILKIWHCATSSAECQKEAVLPQLFLIIKSKSSAVKIREV